LAEEGVGMPEVEVELLDSLLSPAKVAVVRLNRADRRNALSRSMLEELLEAFRGLREGEARSIVLTGSGRYFSSGVEFGDAASDPEGFLKLGQLVYRVVSEMPKPVVCCVNGDAVGAGLELALACDFRVASDVALLGFPEAGLGLMPGFGGLGRLLQLVGAGWSLKLLLEGSLVTGRRAAEIGLVEEAYPAGDVWDMAYWYASRLAENSPTSIRALKSAVAKAARGDLSFDDILAMALECAMSEDALEAALALAERRKPVFKWHG